MVTSSPTNNLEQKDPRTRALDLESAIARTEYSIYEPLNLREKHFIECVEDTIDSLGGADHEDVINLE